MTFDSVYDMTNPIDTVRKQHFWEYFSGSKLQEASPSFTDNFSSSTGWTQVTNTNSGVVGGELIGLTNSSGSNGDGVWKDYGLIFDDNKFVLRCKFQIVTQSGNAGNASTLYFGLSDTNGATSPHSARDGFGIAITNYAVSGMLWNYPDGATWDNADTDLSLVPTATTYYLEFKRTSATSVTFTLYSDSGFSSVVRTHTQSISSNLNGLRYLMMQGWRNGSSNTTKVAVSNLELYNGVSNTAGRWTTTTGGASIEMNDDGGLKLYTTSTGTNSNFTMNFDNKRQYAHDGSVCIFTLNADVQQASTTNWFLQVGLGHTVGNTGHWLSAKSAQSYLRLQTSQSESATYSADTTVSNSPAWVTAKIENKSSSCDLSLNGTVAVTNSSGLQTSTGMQPVVYGNRGTSGSAGSNPLVCKLRYFEAYNT